MITKRVPKVLEKDCFSDEEILFKTEHYDGREGPLPTSDFKLSTEFLKFKRNSMLSILPVFVSRSWLKGF